MRLRPALLLAFARHTLPVTLPAAVIAVAFLLVRREPLVDSPVWPLLFITLHTAAIIQRVDSFHSSWFTFYRTRGFTMPTLAAHGLLAIFASVLLVWALGAVVIWTGARSEFQDTVMRSPYGPFLCRLERELPIQWLGAYAVLVSVFHYALVRYAQPTRGVVGGLFLGLGFGIVWILLIPEYRHPSLQRILWPCGCVCALISLIGSLQLHRRLEVRA